MKVNLLLNSPKDCLSGYVNIDPISEPTKSGENPVRFKEDVTNFDSLCDDAEASEIIATHILSFFPANDINAIFDYWLKKLRHGATLRVVDIDVIEVCKSLVTGAILLEDANLLLYGEQREPWEYRKCCLTVNQVVEVLKNKGFRILKKSVNQNVFVVEAQRP